jgi:hypothetical protein
MRGAGCVEVRPKQPILEPSNFVFNCPDGTHVSSVRVQLMADPVTCAPTTVMGAYKPVLIILVIY